MEFSEYIELAKKALLSPSEAFKKYKLTVGESIVYYIILLIINSILAAIFFPKMLVMMIPLNYSVGILVALRIIGGVVGILIGSAWLHLFVMLFGGRGYNKTLAVNVIASTPMLLLGWIPFVGIITWIWGFVLLVMGISSLHKFSTGRSLAVVIISGLVPLLILVMLLVLVFASVSSLLSMFAMKAWS